MTVSLPKIVPLMAAVTMSFLALAPTIQPVYANRGPDFRLTTVEAVSGTNMAGETMWRCSDNGCFASNATSRPAVVCAKAAKELGKLESFSFKDVAFDAEALAKCNERAN